MFSVILYTILFSIVTVISILLTGSRSFITGAELTPMKLISMLIDWHFILGASFAFLARLFFILINNSLLKIPSLAESSTTVTMFITTITMVFVIVANYYFLGERITIPQSIGALVIIFGIIIISR